MQEKSILDAKIICGQSPTSTVGTSLKSESISIEHLLGALRLNLTQPECSDGSRSG